jgi:rare lipoprotein A
MFLRFDRLTLLGAVSLLMAGCSTTPPPAPPRPVPPAPQPQQPVQLPPRAGVYKIGEPYQIDSVWYYPQEQPTYDETGIASWYGPAFYGRPTANGEIYDGDKLTAAHKTLPMPVHVRVTNLENGRSIVVRVNDRGPFARGRIIDLSRRAAELLDMTRAGTARVRVQYMNRADLGGGAPVDDTPPAIANALPAAPSGRVESSNLGALPGTVIAPPVQAGALPVPVPTAPLALAANEPSERVEQVPVPAATRLYVQIGAFGNITNARRLMTTLGGDLQISTVQRNGQSLYRVRSGPFASVQDADAALARINVQAGGGDARIVVDQ